MRFAQRVMSIPLVLTTQRLPRGLPRPSRGLSHYVNVAEIHDEVTNLLVELQDVPVKHELVVMALFLLNGMRHKGARRRVAYLSTKDDCL